MKVIINCSRPGKGTTRYVEGLIDDDPIRIKTRNNVTLEFSRMWCEEIWWANGCVPQGILVGAVVKYLFYRKWFSIMQLLDREANHLGYYLNINTPIQKVDAEYFLTDLFLDLWISPDGEFTELDREELEDARRAHLISQDQYRKANRVTEILKRQITSGVFFKSIH